MAQECLAKMEEMGKVWWVRLIAAPGRSSQDLRLTTRLEMLV